MEGPGELQHLPPPNPLIFAKVDLLLIDNDSEEKNTTTKSTN